MKNAPQTTKLATGRQFVQKHRLCHLLFFLFMCSTRHGLGFCVHLFIYFRKKKRKKNEQTNVDRKQFFVPDMDCDCRFQIENNFTIHFIGCIVCRREISARQHVTLCDTAQSHCQLISEAKIFYVFVHSMRIVNAENRKNALPKRPPFYARSIPKQNELGVLYRCPKIEYIFFSVPDANFFFFFLAKNKVKYIAVPPADVTVYGRMTTIHM